MHIIGHRGGPPENTLYSIETAIRMGADAVEFDVNRTADNRLVLMHDDLLDRTTTGQGYVSETTFDELQQFTTGQEQPIPTLDEALDLIDRRVPAHIELKAQGIAPFVALALRERLLSSWEPTDFVVSSFDHHELQNFNTYRPEIPFAPILSGKPLDYARYAAEMGAHVMTLNHEFIDQAFVNDARKRDVHTINAFTVNQPPEMLRMRDLGVDGIFTDDIALAQQTLGRAV